jgi:hypothetical protein
VTPHSIITTRLKLKDEFFKISHYASGQYSLAYAMVHIITMIRSFFVLFCQLSILVHPDKNQDDPDRAQQAFES